MLAPLHETSNVHFFVTAISVTVPTHCADETCTAALDLHGGTILMCQSKVRVLSTGGGVGGGGAVADPKF